jgi:hypothetical protein
MKASLYHQFLKIFRIKTVSSYCSFKLYINFFPVEMLRGDIEKERDRQIEGK